MRRINKRREKRRGKNRGLRKRTRGINIRFMGKYQEIIYIKKEEQKNRENKKKIIKIRI